MNVLYNEIDPYAAQWLRNLIAAGHIARGVVDERSVIELEPDYLACFTQCHFFAGIGVWSHALRLAGWPDDRPVWTGSCPCQPFSNAGKGGGHEDERHLWPAWHRLIRECRPGVVFGEQVASKDGLAWLDVVCTDMEATRYAIGAADLCAAGVGAPHIRQRLFFVADSMRGPARQHARELPSDEGQYEERAATGDHGPRDRGAVGVLADTEGRRLGQGSADASRGDERARAQRSGFGPADDCGGSVADAIGSGLGEQRRRGLDCQGQTWTHADEHHEGHRLMGDAGRQGLSPSERQELSGPWRREEGRATGESGRTFWSAADWLPCRDGKARPVEPGTFPLAHGATARVGRLRAFGNAIVAPLAQTFIEAYIESTP